MEKVFLKYFDDVFGSLREPLVLLDNDFKVVRPTGLFTGPLGSSLGILKAR